MEKSIVSKNYVNLKRVRRRKRLWRELPFHLMLLPGVILVFIYMYLPMIGLKIAFENFIPAKGLFGPQKFVGMRNFQMLLRNPQTMPALRNTIIISAWKMALHLLVPVIVSILLNEIQSNAFRRISQTLIYLPHFLSWIILAGIMIDLLSPNGGLVNRFLGLFGAEPIFFLGSNKWFRFTLVFTDVWKEFGFGTIVYLAAITNIDPTQYEAATIDGANRFQRIMHVTLPNMRMIIVLMMVLSLGNVLNAGFDQVYNMYSEAVYSTGDILDTFIYRLSFKNGLWGQSAAVSMFKSVVSTLFISVSYLCAYKFADYRVF